MNKNQVKRILSEVAEGVYFADLPAAKLWEALVERIEYAVDIEESEIKTILSEIAERLGTLEETTCKLDATAEIERLTAQNKLLIEKYSDHEDMCAVYSISDNDKCDCGFDQIAKMEGEK